MQTDVTTRANGIIAEHLGKEVSSRDDKFYDDLGADSLDMVELTMAFEEEFAITIPDDDAEKLETVGQAHDYLATKLA